ncbi:MAG TPA: SAM-dependent methyltransferase, partial [bacterium]|nr:SAM-dependent methyltransferase [bacterium]
MKKTITKQGFIRFYTYLTVFTAGAVILMLEILGSRIMAPYYGNTIYVWSSLISVAMLALAAGYFLGGWIADRRPSYSVLYGVIFLASLFMLLIPVMSSQVLMAANKLGPRYGAFFGAAVLFTAPLLLLGVVSPFAVRLSLKNIE